MNDQNISVRVKVKGIEFKVETEFNSLVGTKAKVTPAPVEGWDGAISGYGCEFCYKIELRNGDRFFRKFADEILLEVGDGWKEGDVMPPSLHLAVDPDTSRVIYRVVD